MGFIDEDYKNLGVNFLDNEKEIIKNSEIVIQLALPEEEKLSLFKRKSNSDWLIKFFLNKKIRHFKFKENKLFFP